MQRLDGLVDGWTAQCTARVAGAGGAAPERMLHSRLVVGQRPVLVPLRELLARHGRMARHRDGKRHQLEGANDLLQRRRQCAELSRPAVPEQDADRRWPFATGGRGARRRRLAADALQVAERRLPGRGGKRLDECADLLRPHPRRTALHQLEWACRLDRKDGLETERLCRRGCRRVRHGDWMGDTAPTAG